MTQEQKDKAAQVIEGLKNEMPEQVDLADLCGAEPFMGSYYGWDNSLGYALDNAIKLFEELMSPAQPTETCTVEPPKPARLDENGLMPCGCGGEVYPHYQLGWCHESGVQAFEVSTGCDGCGTCTKPRRGHYVNGIDKDDTELASKRDWNTSHGYTDPPLPEVKG